MELMDRNIEIRLIDRIDLTSHRDVLLNLLEDNLRTNFSNMSDLAEFALRGYNDMLRYQQDNSAFLIGAFEGARIIGFVWAHKRVFLGETRMHVGHIVVGSGTRSRGLGTQLLDSLESLTRDCGITTIELITSMENEKAMNFYKSNGFSATRLQFEKNLGV